LTIEAPPEKGSIAGILLMVLFIGTLTMGIALLGHRRWQNGIAKELLIGRGLSEVEADAHMATVASTRKIPLFSSAVVLAGLDAGEVQSSTSKVEEEKAAEMAAIYGDQSTSEMQGNSAFAPPSFAQQTISQGSQAAAADAMALFNDETPAPLTQPAIPAAQVSGELYTSAPQTVVKSGGVSLPEGVNTPSPKTVPEISAPQVQPEPTTKSVACSGCSTVFEVQIPPGANTVVVACPTCSRDTTVSA
jgi:hypothetical protein